MARSCASPSHALGSSGRAKARPAAFASRNPRGIARGRHVGLETAVSAIDQRGTLNPDLSYDEEFCIIDKGCGNVLRRLTASPEDVAQLDALLLQHVSLFFFFRLVRHPDPFPMATTGGVMM